MSEYVELAVAPDRAVVVQVEDEEGTEAASRLGALRDRAISSYEDAMSGLSLAAETAMSEALRLSNPPAEVSVQFAVQLATEFGVAVAKGTTAANMTIGFKWTLG